MVFKWPYTLACNWNATNSDVFFEIWGLKKSGFTNFLEWFEKSCQLLQESPQVKGLPGRFQPGRAERPMTLVLYRERVIVMVMSIPADMLLSPK